MKHRLKCSRQPVPPSLNRLRDVQHLADQKKSRGDRWVNSPLIGVHLCLTLRKASRHPTLDRAVNKRPLLTAETGEFTREKVGFGLDPGLSLRGPRSLSSNPREGPAYEKARNVANTGAVNGGAAVNQMGPTSWGRKGVAPQEHGFATFSLKIHSYSWGPGMDSNSSLSSES